MWEVGEVFTLRCLSHPWPSGCSLLLSSHPCIMMLYTWTNTLSGHRLPHSRLAQPEILALASRESTPLYRLS